VSQDLGRSDDAVAAFRRAVELRPSYFEAYASWGWRSPPWCAAAVRPHVASPARARERAAGGVGAEVQVGDLIGAGAR
jgi:hypothetical protein